MNHPHKSIPAFIAWLLLMLAATQVSADVEFSGLEPDQETNVRVVMPLATTDCETAQWRVERLFRDSDNHIREALEALGYYDFTVDKSFTTTDDCWLATFDVTVGEPVRLRNVEIHIVGPGADDPFLNRTTDLPLAGEILNHGRYEKLKASLLAAAITRGYFDASYEASEVTVDPTVYAADLVLRLHSGDQYHFGPVTFTEGILRRDLLVSYSDMRPGDPYRADTISDLYEALSGSNYFATVSISTEPLDRTQKIVPVTVTLTPGTRSIYSVGAGFATDTGVHGRVGYTNRRRNRDGHQFESNLFLSSIRSELTAGYRWPIDDPRKEWFSVVSGVQHEETETSESDTFKFGVQRATAISASWLETRYLDLALENFEVGLQDTSSRLLILGINRESAQGREIGRTTNGRRLSFDLRGASDKLGSDTSFLQFRSTANWIFSLNDTTRLLARGNLGLTLEDNLADLPASVRFFAGGDRSVRGYEFETLGPTDITGAVIGGRHLITASIEIDRLVRPDWTVAAFVDTGSAFNNSDIELSTGIGLGIRWYSPIGPLRIDLAHPLDDPDEDFRIHISLGPDL